MSTLEEMIRSGSPATPIQFRAKPYGSEGEREFLRDLLAMANADVKGARLIVVGVDTGASGAERILGVEPADFNRQPSYVELATRYIHPPIPFSYSPANHGDVQVGIFHLGACTDGPYVMRADHSAELRRGDAWVRLNNESEPLQLPEAKALSPTQSKDCVDPEQMEIGFAGEMTYQQMTLPVCDLSQLPSVLAAGKVRQLLVTQKEASGTGNTTMMVRLTHARLFADSDPYQPQAPEALQEQMKMIALRHRADDRQFMFEVHGGELQLRVFNQSSIPLENASITLTLPNLSGLYVARNPDDDDYPVIEINDDVAVVTASFGPVPAGSACPAFKKAIKLCAGQILDGQRLLLGYSLMARNLSSPLSGQLAIDFRDQLQALMG
jgi:hypothetical protein